MTHPTLAVPFDATAILAQLAEVDAQRRQRGADLGLSARVQAVKQYQQRRFAHTYAALLGSARYRNAARFFLDELYGPQDFSSRDAQLARVIPALVRLFPQRIVDVVGTVVSLHALSERLDSAMGRHLMSKCGSATLLIPPRGADDVVVGLGAFSGSDLDAQAYAAAWQATGQPRERERQVALTLQVGTALDDLVRKPLLRRSLHLMRGPARAAGLADLQAFLERGVEAFSAMQGAAEFLTLVAQRERQLAAALFQAVDSDPMRIALTLLPRE